MEKEKHTDGEIKFNIMPSLRQGFQQCADWEKVNLAVWMRDAGTQKMRRQRKEMAAEKADNAD